MSDSPPVRCSSAGCRADAAWTVAWRNPRIHSADRVKTWLACDAHRDTLRDYLATRGLPVAVLPFGDPLPASIPGDVVSERRGATP